MINLIQSKLRFFLSIILTVAGLPMVAFADTYVREDLQSFDAATVQNLSISTGSGDIEVSTWDQPTVEIKVLMSIRAKNEDKANAIFDATELVYENDAGSLDVKVKSNSNGSFFGLFKTGPQVNISVKCPATMNMKANSGSGDIKVDGLVGQHKFNTGSGDISGENLSGTAKASTGSGDIRLNKVEGLADCGTGSGNISIKQLNGMLDASTGSGNIQAKGSITSFKSGTGSGNINITSDVVIDTDSKASAGSGQVSVILPAESSLALDLKTESGSVDCSFPVEVEKSDKKSLVGTTNGGGHGLRLRSGSGNLSVKHP